MQAFSVSKHSQRKSLANLSVLIRKESRAATLFVHTVSEIMNMQISDIRCLDFLIETRFATAGELSKVAGLTTGATTAMIDRLEKAKFVKREADSTDRRKIIVTFTGNKSHHFNITNNFFSKSVPKLLSTYTIEERKLIADWNEKMTILFQDEIKRLRNVK